MLPNSEKDCYKLSLNGQKRVSRNKWQSDWRADKVICRGRFMPEKRFNKMNKTLINHPLLDNKSDFLFGTAILCRYESFPLRKYVSGLHILDGENTNNKKK